MKIFRLVFALGLVIAGVMLLCEPKGEAQAFVPTRFTVTDAGTVGKPDVILIPGLSSSKSVWDGEVKLLAPNYRLHVLQVDGFAGAPAGANAGDAPMLPGIAEELHQYVVAGKMKPVVVGHSLGGLLGLMLADKHPEDVRKLVIVDALPYYAVLFRADATVESVRPMAQGMLQQIAVMPDDQFGAMQDSVVPGLVKSADGQKAVRAADIASDRKVFAKAMFEDLQTDLRGDVAGIKTPTLMLYPYDASAVKDAAAIDAVYQGAYKAMPNVKLVRVDDSRHFIMYDQPGKMDAEIENFLK